jgi:hypothetical protein
MAPLSEKATMSIGDVDSPKPSSSNSLGVTNFGHSDTFHQKKLVQSVTDDQYPHGLKLVLLAGASIIAVFMIALDQVSSTLPAQTDTRRSLTQKDSRLSSAQQFLRSQTISTASQTCLGTQQPTS